MNKRIKSRCPLCGGLKKNGSSTFTADLGEGVVVVRKVDAMICDQCGEEWILPETAKKLEEIVESARKEHRQFEVVQYE